MLKFTEFMKSYYDITDAGVTMKKGMTEDKILEDFQQKNQSQNNEGN